MIDLQVAVDKLNGMECEEIRHFFRLEGIKGRSGSANCPIALWLAKVTGKHVLVGSEDAAVVLSDIASTPLADGPREFIRHFDSHEYPELTGIPPRVISYR